MKLNENKELEKIGEPLFRSSLFQLWGAPFLVSNIMKFHNKEGGELEGLT